MGDLMNGTTSYVQLNNKYAGFDAPTVKMMVDGTDLVAKCKAKITNLSIELTCGFEASGCTFSLIDEYDNSQSAFKKGGSDSKIQLGAKVEISIGYIVVEKVFCGYVSQISYSFSGEDAPTINVECIDAKGIMMKRQRLEFFTQKKVDSAIKAILSEQPYSTYIDTLKVDSVSGDELVLQSAMDSDYDFIVAHAKKLGYEFFIMQEKAYFRRPPASSPAIMTLSPRTVITDAQFILNSSELVESVRFMGINSQNYEPVKGEKKISGKFSSGSTAKRMMEKTVKVFYDQEVTSASLADSRAGQMMAAIQNSFGTLSCGCIGIPELVPGRSVKIDELMPQANKTFYITNVTHSIIDGDFSTSFEARIDSL